MKDKAKEHIKKVENAVRRVKGNGINWLTIHTRIRDNLGTLEIYTTIEDGRGCVQSTVKTSDFSNSADISLVRWTLEDVVEDSDLNSDWKVH